MPKRCAAYHLLWTLCAFSAVYTSFLFCYSTQRQAVVRNQPRFLLKHSAALPHYSDSEASVEGVFRATQQRLASHRKSLGRPWDSVVTAYVRVPNNLSAAARSPQMSTHCIQDWSVPAATTVTDDDAQRWASREKPYGGCELKDGQCRYAGGCSNYDVHEYAFVDSSALGSCGSHDHLDVRPAAPGTDCVNKTFIPLHLPELFFFGHLDTLMTKLVRIIARGDHRDALLYVPYHWSFSERVVALLDLMGIGYVTEFPEGKCFARVVWVCHSVSFDPEAARNTSVALRAAVARTAAPTGRSRCKNVYFMRTLGSSRNGRLVANEEGFARYLRDHHGFCIMTGGETLSALAYVVGHADLIAGTHGGALMNLVFLDPARRPAVIELEGYGKYAKYWLLATGMGHRYGWMSFDPNVGIDQGRFLQLMKQLLVQQRSLHRKSTPPAPQRTYLERVESMYADD